MTAKELGAEPANPAEVTFSMDGIIQGMQTGDRSYKLLGLSKREYFAGLAMQGIVSAGISNGIGVSKPDYAAHWAVEYADALLEELAKEK